jgi:hypothetical protein
MALLKVLGTLYFACLPQAGTWYNEVLLLVSRFLLLILISNDELRSKNEEVGICVLTQMTLLKVLGTLYFACLPQAGTSYNEVLLQKKRLPIRSLFSFFLFFLPSSP